HLGLAVPGFFFEPRSGALYPLVFRALQRDLGHAIQHAAFEFAQMQTTFPVEDYRSLGRRALVDATGAADARLAKLARELDFLLAITPVNTEEAWQRFSANGYSRNPALHYRPLTVDPDLYRRDLYAVKIEEAEDPAVAALLRAKRQELDEIVMLLEERGTRRFLLTSLKLFGGVDDDLAAMAESLLARVDRDGRTDPAELIPVGELADLARAEIRRYAEDAPVGDARVIVRDDVPGVMVVGADVIIGANSRIARARAQALLQHEVGTHLVTAINGRAQPLKLLEVGLPGYMETQEGLAVFAEYVAGGLTTRRLATLAARVVAVRALIDGAEFVDTFRALHRDVGLTPRRAFSVAMRVHRAGGLTKDAIYLRGVDAVLRYLAVPNSVEPLIVGKLALPDVEIIEELQRRGVLKPPPLRPRWLDFPDGRARLESARRGLTVLDLAEGSTL
ncbi:MAG TPA: tyrosine/phenylalanine carboxypeptidase domain-containing protein, partial [Egibacteraceae bacterium]|nr:tyrosine/phenylalanine carboxypeptidase domain-containing protein [Egibacteraceae bacterium]